MTATDPFSGVEIAVEKYLEGSKKAIKFGNTVYVSPAMWELLRHAEGEELMQLLKAIKWVDMGEPPDFFSLPQFIPLITSPV